MTFHYMLYITSGTNYHATSHLHQPYTSFLASVRKLSFPAFPLSDYPVFVDLLDKCGRWAFATAGPFAWNSLPGPVHNPNSTKAAFRRLLKDIFVRTVLAHPAH